MEQYYYNSRNGQTYSSAQMLGLFGLNTATLSVAYINSYGFYPVQASSPDFDTMLYNSSVTWSIVSITGGEGAVRVYAPVAKPLPEAKENGKIEEKQKADATTANILTVNYLTSDVLTSVASQAEVDRPAQLQAVLDETVAVSNALGANLDAIDAATSVDEINNIVNPPTGVLFTGRGATGPLDLNVSYYTAFNSVSLDQSQTELYVPGTDTVIPYLLNPMTGQGTFDSSGDCFVTGDYLVQIRQVSNSRVIAEFECPLNPANENVTF